MRVAVKKTPKQQLLEHIETLNDNQILFSLTLLEESLTNEDKFIRLIRNAS